MAPVAEIPDQCPVCKGDRVTNPDIQFKINTKCYHRICESCVDRHYRESGAKICPVYGCNQKLWKREWRPQTFEDLGVEREIVIRKRVERILNRTEDEFESARAYNDFLELRETMAMNLVLETDVKSTNHKLSDYQGANNVQVDKVKEDLKAKALWKTARENGDADPSGLVQGLKKIVAPPPVADYDPFEGMPTVHDYFSLKDDYVDILHPTKPGTGWAAGGFNFMESVEESLTSAFAGLGVFLEDEKAIATAPSLAGVRASVAAKAVDDVF